MVKTGPGEVQSGPMLHDSTLAADMLIRVENAEAKRLGVRVAEARTTIARRIRTGVGTLRNIRRERRKTIPSWLMNAIREELVRVLQNQIAALEHELHIALQVDGGHRTDDVVAAQTRLAQAKEILGRQA